MGSACCVAAKDKSIKNGSSREMVQQRNARYSPSWSFRWDNRGRVAGEDTTLNWFNDGLSRSSGLEVKSGTTVGTTYASEEGSPIDSFRMQMWHKSPISEGDATGISRQPPSVYDVCTGCFILEKSVIIQEISYQRSGSIILYQVPN